MDFNNHVLETINFFGINIWLTESLINSLIIVLILCLTSIILNIFIIKNFKDKPRKFQNILETIVEIISNLIKNNFGKNFLKLEEYFFGLFIFLIFSNLSSLIGLRPPTADFSVTLALSIITFFFIHITGIISNNKKYFKSYLEPNFIMLPINLISEIAVPISLSFRLFGNMFGGLVIMSMIYKMLPLFIRFWFPGILHIYFDVFTGFLQAFIFITLSITFIKNKKF